MSTFKQEDLGQSQEELEKIEETKADESAFSAEQKAEDEELEKGEKATVTEDAELNADADTPVEQELPAQHGTQTAANLGLQSDASGSYTTNRD